MREETGEFGELLGEGLAAVVGPAITGVYLHGSAALGGFRPEASDVDILVVVNSPMSRDLRRRVALALQDAHELIPGRGIEASVILGEVAAAGGGRLDFELHVCTDPADPKVIEGDRHSGDPDLILHMAVCRQSAIAAFGPQPAEVFAEVDPQLVLGQMISELRWGLEHAPEAYAVLNACRAHFYLEHGVFCSKVEGGLWARDRFDASALIDRALGTQQGSREASACTPETEVFVAGAISALTQARGTGHF